jgi:hypothetical protein
MSQERRHPYGAQASLACGSPASLPVLLTQVQLDQAARSQECSDEQQTKGYPETNRAQSKSFRHRNVPEPLKNRREQQWSENQNGRDEEDEKHGLHLYGRFCEWRALYQPQEGSPSETRLSVASFSFLERLRKTQDSTKS